MAGKDRSQRNSLSVAQSKGNMAMYDFERTRQIRDSSENRLRRDVTDLENQEVSSILSIRRDQRLLKDKLFSVQQSTGHYNEKSKNTKSRRKLRQKGSTGESNNSGKPLHPEGINRLPSLVITENEQSVFANAEDRGASSQGQSKTNAVNRSRSLEGGAPKPISKETALSLPEMNQLSKSENALNNAAWYTNMDEVRSTIQQRLSNSMNDLSKSNSDKALEPFLYAPPDGLPRTMYLMPSMDDQFKQAMRARYIRKPGTKIDPIERELNLDEIFDSSQYKKS